MENIAIGPATDRSPALALLFSQDDPALAAAQRTSLELQDAKDGSTLAHLLAAVAGGELLGAVLGVAFPGRTAVIWPARVVSPPGVPLAERLHAELDRRLAEHGAQLAQAVLPPGDARDAALLARARYEFAAETVYLGCENRLFPTAAPETALEFETVEESGLDRLARVVERTYEQTLDCPALNDMRSAVDVIEGYKATGVVQRGQWLLVRSQDRDVGCLLLTDHAEDDQWELVYMGIVPPARGGGLGMEIVRQAQWLTRRSGRARLVLAVDAANRPALEMYRRTGFEEWDRRHIWLKALG